MDLNCPLLQVNKQKQDLIKISWQGNEDCFTKNKQHLLDVLGNGSLSWQREAKSSGFPLNLKFSLSFVSFNADKCILQQAVDNLDKMEHMNFDFAYLHIYFLHPANLEEYKFIRPDISEWFAFLNEAECAQWLILFDSSRSKDKKSRNQLIDKLKSDFVRFQNKIFEFTDLSSEKTVSSLCPLLQNNLFASFEFYIKGLTSLSYKLKENMLNENAFSPHLLINAQFRLCFFYWSIGLFEMALNELDSLAIFLTDSMRSLMLKNESKDQSSPPNWLKQLRLLPFGRSCVLLSMQMCFNSLEEEDWTLTKLHSHLLAHQILLNVQILNQKLDIAISPTEESKRQQELEGQSQKQLNTLQIRHDTAISILRCAHDTFKRLEEDLVILKANFNVTLLRCLFVMWQQEIFTFCDYVLGEETNIVEMQSASEHTCFLLHKRCEAVQQLLHTIKCQQNQELTLLRRWLEQTSLTVPVSSEDSSLELAASILQQYMDLLVSSNESLESKFKEFTKSSLVNALSVFEQFGWFRHAHYLRDQLAELALEDGDQKNSYEYSIQNLDNFITHWDMQMQIDNTTYLSERIEKFEEEMRQRDPNLLFDSYIILIYLSREDQNKVDRWIDGITKLSNIVRNNSDWLRTARKSLNCQKGVPTGTFPFPIQVVVPDSPVLIYALLHQEFSIEMEINNEMPITLHKCQLTAQFVQLSTTSHPDNSSSTTGRIFTSVAKEGQFFLDSHPANSDEATSSAIENSAVKEGISLLPGPNKCLFDIKEDKNVGCFKLQRVRLDSSDPKWTFIIDLSHQFSVEHKIAKAIYFIDIIKPNIWLDIGEKTISTKIGQEFSGGPVQFISGICQHFWLELSSGTITHGESTESELTISSIGLDNECMKFLNEDGEWRSQATFSIPQLSSNGKHRILVKMCMSIEKIEREFDQLKNENIEIKVVWMFEKAQNIEHFFPVVFHPVMNLKFDISQLAGDVIFILDIKREKCNENVNIVPTSLMLSQEQNIALEPLEADLLTPKPFTPIVANSLYRFVWKLPEMSIGKAVCIPHFLNFRYKVEEKCKDQNQRDQMEYVIDKRLDFPIRKVEYEICARFFSDHSKSVLCRIDQPCDLIVSFRSLAKLTEAHTIVASIEPGKEYWHCAERHKLVKVKDCGVGQAIFSVVPRMIGFLPFPGIALHKYNVENHSPSRQHSLNEKRFGERLITFYRNKGTQIHILATLNSSEDAASQGSTQTTESEQKRKSLKSQAKDRLQKLFE